MFRAPRLISVPRPKARRAGALRSGHWRADELAAVRRYAPAGTDPAPFIRFCAECVQILDKEVKPAVDIPFVLFPAQERVAADLVAGRWLLILKARQLGLTWLVAAYVVWRMLYGRQYLCMCIAQPGGFAADFAGRVLFMLTRFPAWCRIRFTKRSDSQGIYRLGNDSELRVLEPGTQKAHQAGIGRSFTGDFAVIDEAALVPGFTEILNGIRPGMRRSTNRAADGQVAVITTSQGPEGDFAELVWDTYGQTGELLDENGVGPTGFKLTFLAWWERPGRTPEWRERQLIEHGTNKGKWEYPATLREAMSHAIGRVYPFFEGDIGGKHVGDIDIPSYAKRGRAIDWGETKSAFVVLWIAVIENCPPGFLVSPSCPNTIREFLGYRVDEKNKPIKGRDHTCDALRYFVVTHNCRCLVYVYREEYIVEAVEKGLTPLKEIARIHELSGWAPSLPTERTRWERGAHGEIYDLVAVSDPSLGLIRNEFSQAQIPCIAAMIPKAPAGDGRMAKDSPFDAKMEGIRMVRELIDATLEVDRLYPVRRPGGLIRPPVWTAPSRGAAALGRLLELRRQRKGAGR